MSRIGRPIEAEGRLVVAGGRGLGAGWGRMGSSCFVDGVFFYGDEHVLQLGRADGCKRL